MIARRFRDFYLQCETQERNIMSVLEWFFVSRWSGRNGAINDGQLTIDDMDEAALSPFQQDFHDSAPV